ncbi:hypothetical protein BDF14DRAFT_1714559, partial [Spinellus fusiger]
RKIQGSKKRKTPDINSKQEGYKGTTTGHYLRFLNETLNIMNKHDEIRFCLIMDNMPIHSPKKIE